MVMGSPSTLGGMDMVPTLSTRISQHTEEWLL